MTLKIDYDVAANIRALRRQAEMTQQQVADWLEANGAPGRWFATNLSLIESGNRGIREGALPYIARALGVREEALRQPADTTARQIFSTKPEAHGKYAPIFARLRNRPDEWERVADGQASASQATRLQAEYPGSEVVSRQNPDGTYDLFARYPIGTGERTPRTATITPPNRAEDVTLE